MLIAQVIHRLYLILKIGECKKKKLCIEIIILYNYKIIVYSYQRLMYFLQTQ